MSKNKTLVGFGIAIIAVLVIVIAGIILGNLLIPDISQQIPSDNGQNYVNVTLPVNGATLPVNQPVTVFVEAFGDQAIQSIELMVDGALLPNPSPDLVGGKKMISSWAFTPDKERVYTLIGRVKTISGLNIISNAVNINITSADKIPLPLVNLDTPPVPVVNSDSIESQLAGGTTAPPPPGFNDLGEADNPPPPPKPDEQESPDEPAGDSGGSLIPIKFSVWAENLSKNLIGFDKALPDSPTLDGGTKQCSAVIIVQDNSANELGFFLYRLDPGHQLFNRVATLNATPGKGTFSYQDSGLEQGTYTYYLTAFNSAGEAAGNVITVQIKDGQCDKSTSQMVDFESLKLTTKTPVDKVYCYFSTDNKIWMRVPEAKDLFIQSTNGEFDLNPYLGPLAFPAPPQTRVTIFIECWGWNGSTLIFLGKGQQSWTPGENLVLGGEAFDITGKGEGGYKIMKAKYPKTSRIAPPYGFHGSKNANECKKYFSDAVDIGFCEDASVLIENIYLFWVWHQYGSCNPGLQTDCDMTLQPAQGFLIYTIDKNGEIEELYRRNGTKKPFAFSKLPACDDQGNAIYETYVVAYSEELGESLDSNHIKECVNKSKMTIKPDTFQSRNWIEYGDKSEPPGWKTSKPDKIISSGYSFTYLAGNPLDMWISGMVNFNLQEIQGDLARLNWKNRSLSSKGPGSDDVKKSCTTRLAYRLGTETTQHILPNLSFYSESYDVSQPFLEAKEKNSANIEFWFLGPDRTEKNVSVRPDSCVWSIHEISLTIEKQPSPGP